MNYSNHRFVEIIEQAITIKFNCLVDNFVQKKHVSRLNSALTRSSCRRRRYPSLLSIP